MNEHSLPLTRRRLLVGLGGTAMVSLDAKWLMAQGSRELSLRAEAGTIPLRSGEPTAVWQLQDIRSSAGRLAAANAPLTVSIDNQLPMAIVPHLRGLDGAAPASAQNSGVSQGQHVSIAAPGRQAGTFLAEFRATSAATIPARPLPLIVPEEAPYGIDQDEVLMFEDWRLRPDNMAVVPGNPVDQATALITVNGEAKREITARPGSRIRLRFINASQRTALAVLIKNHEMWVLATDSHPAEPFPARNGQLVLAPGTRIDAVVDVAGAADALSDIVVHDGRTPRVVGTLRTAGDPVRSKALPPPQALPAQGLPERINLQTALRVDLSLGHGNPSDLFVSPSQALATPPALRVRNGRAVVLALTNRGPTPQVFHLHGHHFRLLDRLDDGWKPFWLDTLMIDKGQTQRIAFVAEHPGQWQMQAAALEWSAPTLTRWYEVE